MLLRLLDPLAELLQVAQAHLAVYLFYVVFVLALHLVLLLYLLEVVLQLVDQLLLLHP